jgi:hypothetical protein
MPHKSNLMRRRGGIKQIAAPQLITAMFALQHGIFRCWGVVAARTRTASLQSGLTFGKEKEIKETLSHSVGNY